MLTSNKLFWLCALFLLLLSTCAQTILAPSSSPTPEEGTPTGEATTTGTPLPSSESSTPQVTQIPQKFLPIIEKLASSYDLTPDKITLVSIEAVDWSDSCLGVNRPGIACLEVITPGYRLIFETPKGEVEVHANLDVSAFYILSSGSGIKGQVLVINACPGPMRPGQTCPDIPYLGIIQIRDESGNPIAEIYTAEDGSFQVDLPPGTYILTNPSEEEYPMATSQPISVTPGEYSQVQFVIDRGMR